MAQRSWCTSRRWSCTSWRYVRRRLQACALCDAEEWDKKQVVVTSSAADKGAAARSILLADSMLGSGVNAEFLLAAGLDCSDDALMEALYNHIGAGGAGSAGGGERHVFTCTTEVNGERNTQFKVEGDKMVRLLSSIALAKT